MELRVSDGRFAGVIKEAIRRMWRSFLDAKRVITVWFVKEK
jgi:hypothetical protein